jgi:hypothetical protein
MLNNNIKMINKILSIHTGNLAKNENAGIGGKTFSGVNHQTGKE